MSFFILYIPKPHRKTPQARAPDDIHPVLSNLTSLQFIPLDLNLT